ncbi:hypothetical protein EDC56_2955 [Sinobacterium caligoides]|uniref:Uncharacterized protein n=1 Tax=Sinobacterium caligoides TaxID=933926 RepID=A0A3N2DKV3_9GAMM|nr:hypothetical protein [Sinobacterium caligoides]ROS00309.1 hypothetical protein EDC56_2955 [Sinobacterium caligoides]
MVSSLLEIVELANGEIVLRSADGDNRPLINIRFGSASDLVSSADRLEVAKAMIQAGMATFAEIVENQEEQADMLTADECFESTETEMICDMVLH